MDERIRLGISTCLLGEQVRYDGQHKRDAYLTDTLGRYMEYVPVCPEVECGLGVPREPMRLVGDPSAPRLVTVKTDVDLTERMTSWATRRVRELECQTSVGVAEVKQPAATKALVATGDDGLTGEVEMVPVRQQLRIPKPKD